MSENDPVDDWQEKLINWTPDKPLAGQAESPADAQRQKMRREIREEEKKQKKGRKRQERPGIPSAKVNEQWKKEPPPEEQSG